MDSAPLSRKLWIRSAAPAPGRLLMLACLLAAGAGTARADDPCAGFKWDVSKEHALFGLEARSQSAGKDRSTAPRVVPNRLYELKLLPQELVAFAAPPGSKVRSEGTYAGLVSLTAPAAGSYRISVDMPLWIDVVLKGALVPPTDYAGQRDCRAPHKIVVFPLDGKETVLLQLSGAGEATVRLTVTRVSTG